MFFALVLIAVGVIALLVKANVLSGSVWSYAWPVILILLGLSFLFGRFRHRHSRWFGCCPPWDDRDKDKKE
ncbi:MAG: DUF5668 domain-containing protein [Dehalococcoidales bacterium]|jgi:hypothetical protein